MAHNTAFAPTGRKPHGLSESFLRFLTNAYKAWLQRQALSRLNAEALKDIGITEEEAAREARRPIWDVPSHWRR